MIVDSSVWISLFRQKNTPAVRKLVDVALSGVVLSVISFFWNCFRARGMMHARSRSSATSRNSRKSP